MNIIEKSMLMILKNGITVLSKLLMVESGGLSREIVLCSKKQLS